MFRSTMTVSTIRKQYVNMQISLCLERRSSDSKPREPFKSLHLDAGSRGLAWQWSSGEEGLGARSSGCLSRSCGRGTAPVPWLAIESRCTTRVVRVRSSWMSPKVGLRAHVAGVLQVESPCRSRWVEARSLFESAHDVGGEVIPGWEWGLRSM